MREPLAPIDTPDQRAALRWSNRQVLAERFHWPDGHLETCERLGTDWPQWFAMWWPTGASGPEEWSARWIGSPRCRASGATLAELLIDMADKEARIREQQKRDARPFRAIV
jgi:hypothetical protein